VNENLPLGPEASDTSPSSVWGKLISEANEAAKAVTISWWKGGLILANVSLTGTPELVIQVSGIPISGESRTPSSIQVAGLDIWFEAVSFNGVNVPSLLLKPKYSENVEVFYALADHLVAGIAKDASLEASIDSLESVISAWVKFWSKQKPEVSRELLLGLLGELIALDEILDLSESTHSIWEGPKGAPQDFRGPSDSLEVKVQGSHTGPIVHKINGLLQLQIPEDGKLYVLSIRAKLGSNGSHAFHDLVSRVSALSIFKAPEAHSFFTKALEAAGYSKNLPVDFSRYDVIEMGIYEVTKSFPRITKDVVSLDPRVMDVTYSVNFSGAAEFLLPPSDQKLRLN
jgi:hypothetical protein